MGVAGLAAALALSDEGWRVTLYESSPAAGGRCRSYHDKELDCRIDNGNHLWLSGNKAINRFLRRVGSSDSAGGPASAMFPFFDLASGARWTVRPNAGLLPWWLLFPGRGVPGARLAEYAGLLRLLRAGPDATVAETLQDGALYRKLLHPLVVAALNTAPSSGSARLMGAVVRQSLVRGGGACIPRYPREGLSATFIDPALASLRAAGATVQFGRRVTALAVTGGRVTAIGSAAGPVAVADGDAVVLAVPAPVAQALLPGLSAPDAFESIVNLHFRIDTPPGPAGFVGLLGGTTEWVFVKPGIVSVTVSAANRLLDHSSCDLAATVWPETCAALGIAHAVPLHRVVKERRATFAATPSENRKRPAARTGLANLALAGDWTDTGLPATIEGAIRSGETAAAVFRAAA